jgi:predicted permease
LSTIALPSSRGLRHTLTGLRHTLRGLRRRPGFTAAAVLTLAFGIGATAAIFGVVYGVLLKPLPYPHADELVSLKHTAPRLTRGLGLAANETVGTSESLYVTYREENRTFEHVGLWTTREQTLTRSGEPQQVRILSVTDGTLQALGVQPALGRGFSEAEYTLAAQGTDPVILSYAFWQRRFGGDEAVLGRTLSLDFRPAQIVGIMPAGFRFLDLAPQPDIISPIRIEGTQIKMWSTSQPRPLTLSHPNYGALARLEDGATLAEANADVARMLPIWLDAWPASPGFREAAAEWRLAPAVRPLKDDIVGGVAGMLWLLMGTVGAVLLIACANVANLLLVRADARRHELAIRAALGAGRRRIAAELLRESLVLGSLGGAVGLGLAYAGLELLAAFAPPNLPRAEDIAAGPAVLAFAAAAAFVSSLALGSIPAAKYAFDSDALLGTGARGAKAFGTRGASASRAHNRTRSALIVVQVALALVLLVGAGLMIRTFEALTAVDPGFTDPEHVEVASIFIPFAAISDAARYTRVYREVLERIAALPGVTAAGFGRAPLQGGGTRVAISVEGRPDAAGESPPTRRFLDATPGYLDGLGTRLVAGRDLAWADIEQARKVVLVSENLARELWGEPRAAIGKRIRWDARDGTGAWHEIVGVTQNVHEDGLDQPPPPIVYTPLITDGTDLRGVTYVIRSRRAGTRTFADEVRQAVWASHPDIVVTIRTMQEIYAASFARTSFMLVLLAIAGAMALLLSVVGIYAVISYAVSQRAPEIGIRLALGAQPPAVKRMFVLHGLAVAAIGIAAGLGGAAAFSRFLASHLFGVRPLDGATYLAVLAVLLAAVTLAAYLPARRAAGLDPAETLRAE